MFSIEVPKLQSLLKALNSYPQISDRIMQGKIREILASIAERAADYPSSPSGSTYNRTGTLGQEWASVSAEIRTGGSALEGRISNRTPYGPYVQGDEDQAEVHRGRWETIEQIIVRHQAEIDSMLDSAGNEIVDEIEKQAG